MAGNLSVFDKNQLKVARQILKAPDAMVPFMGGGITKEEARDIIEKLTGKRPKESFQEAKFKAGDGFTFRMAPRQIPGVGDMTAGTKGTVQAIKTNPSGEPGYTIVVNGKTTYMAQSELDRIAEGTSPVYEAVKAEVRRQILVQKLARPVQRRVEVWQDWMTKEVSRALTAVDALIKSGSNWSQANTNVRELGAAVGGVDWGRDKAEVRRTFVTALQGVQGKDKAMVLSGARQLQAILKTFKGRESVQRRAGVRETVRVGGNTTPKQAGQALKSLGWGNIYVGHKYAAGDSGALEIFVRSEEDGKVSKIALGRKDRKGFPKKLDVLVSPDQARGMAESARDMAESFREAARSRDLNWSTYNYMKNAKHAGLNLAVGQVDTGAQKGKWFAYATPAGSLSVNALGRDYPNEQAAFAAIDQYLAKNAGESIREAEKPYMKVRFRGGNKQADNLSAAKDMEQLARQGGHQVSRSGSTVKFQDGIDERAMDELIDTVYNKFPEGEYPMASTSR